MRITESRLRRIIKDVINEIAASDDEALLRIGKGGIGKFELSPSFSTERYYGSGTNFTLDYERAFQVFKAWCNINDLSENPEVTIKNFLKDHPTLEGAHNSHQRWGSPGWEKTHRENAEYKKLLINYAKKAYELQNTLDRF